MGLNLSQIVSAAMHAADSEIKVASARDVPARAATDLDALLGFPEFVAPETAKVASVQEPQSTATSTVLSDAELGMKLAEALDLCSDLVKQSAAMPTHVAEPNTAAPAQPKTTASVNGMPSATAGTAMTDTESHFSSMNDHSGTVNNDTAKSAMAAAVQAKTAQAELLGANKVAMELDKGPSGSSVVPDMKTLISMTRAQARDRHTAEVSKILVSTPKKDAIAVQTVAHSAGLKTSGLDPKMAREYFAKISAIVKDDSASTSDRLAAAQVITNLMEYAAQAS